MTAPAYLPMIFLTDLRTAACWRQKWFVLSVIQLHMHADLISSTAQKGVIDAVAGVRIVTSTLGYVSTPPCPRVHVVFNCLFVLVLNLFCFGFFCRMLGACSIIVSSLIRCRLAKSDVHPIFMVSLADCMLAALWIAGSAMWYSGRDTYQNVWCYAVTLTTSVTR